MMQQSFDVAGDSARFQAIVRGRRVIDSVGRSLLFLMGLASVGLGVWLFPRPFWYIEIGLGVAMTCFAYLMLRRLRAVHRKSVVRLTLGPEEFVLTYSNKTTRTIKWRNVRTQLTAIPTWVGDSKLMRVHLAGGGPLVMNDLVWTAFRKGAESAGLRAEKVVLEGKDSDECEVRFLNDLERSG